METEGRIHYETRCPKCKTLIVVTPIAGEPKRFAFDCWNCGHKTTITVIKEVKHEEIKKD